MFLGKFISHLPQIPHKNHAAETFHAQYTACQKHLCHRYDAPTSPPLILGSSQSTCFCGSHFFHAPHLPIVWQEKD